MTWDCGVKYDPLIVMTVSGAPVWTEEGVIDDMFGNRLFTARLAVGELPPPGDGLLTTIVCNVA